MNINKTVSLFTSRVASTLATISMVVMPFAGVTFAPATAFAAAGTYTITGTGSVTGTTATINGTASAIDSGVQQSNTHVAIDWNEDAGNTVDISNVEVASSTVTCPSNGNCNVIWGPNSHLYNVSGSIKIFAIVYHGGITGQDGSNAAQVATITVVIPPTTGKLVVVKNVTNTGGGTAVASNFQLHVLSGATDVSGSPAAGSTSGTTYTLAGGSYTVSEGSNSHYTASFSGDCNGSGVVTVTNGATSTCTVTNTFHNSVPVAQNGTLTVNEDSVNNAGTATATDSDSDSLTYAVGTGPTHASSFTFNNDGTFSYTPVANYNGSDSFTFGSADGYSFSNNATISITVNAVNDNPVANDDTITTSEDTAGSVNAVTNDSDVDGDSLTVSSCTNGAHGTVTVDGSNVTYTPAADFNGSDSFSCTISDGNGGTANETVNVTVGGTNDAPVAVNDSYPAQEDVQLNVLASGVLGNDSDVDGDTLTAVLDSDVSNGTLSLNGDGSFTYTPDANFNGSDSFTYHAKDSSNAVSNEATVTITVTSVNDAPVAVDGEVTTSQNTAVSGALSASDVDLDSLSYDHVYVGTGTLTVDSDTGLFNYTPALNFVGDDTFTFTANDGDADSNVATVTIHVTPLYENNVDLCTDGIDNDHDGDTDLEDSDCSDFNYIDLAVTKTVDDNLVDNGQTVTYTITVTNNGYATAQFAYLDESLPSGLNIVSQTTSMGSSVNNTGHWDIGALEMGDSATLTIEATVNAAFGSILNSVSVGNDAETPADNDSSNNTASVTITVDSAIPQCSDGIDNDQDQTVDFGEEGDLGCSSPTDNWEEENPPISSFNETHSHEVITSALGPIAFSGVSTDDLSGVASAELNVYKVGDSAMAYDGIPETLNCSVGGTLVGTSAVTLNAPNTLSSSWATNWTPSEAGVYCFKVNATDVAGNVEHTAVAGPFAVAPTISTPSTPSTPSNPPTGGNGPIVGSFGVGGGQVLGAATSIYGPGCEKYLTKFIKSGANNDPEQVTRLQTVLKIFEGANIEINGVYDAATLSAVHAFQSKYAADILHPWGASRSTGFVYLTTRKKVNEIYCAAVFPLAANEQAEVDAYRKAHEGDTTPAPSADMTVPTPAASAPAPTETNDQPSNDSQVGAATASDEGSTSSGGFWGFLKGIFGR